MEELLISSFYKRKAIWDPADELRKNSKILKALWAEIAKEVGVDVNVAKSRWKNLRAYFMSQLRELDKPRAGSDACIKTTSSWAFYNQLLFLKDVLMSSDDAREDSLALTKASELSDKTLVNEINDGFNAEHFLASSISEVGTMKDTFTDTISAFTMADKQIASASQPGTLKENLSLKNDEGSSQDGKMIDFSIKRANIDKRKLNVRNKGPTQKRCGEILDIERWKVELLEREISADNNPELLFFKSLLPYMEEFTSEFTFGQKFKI